jgi:SAM-dependent methyltransferase
MKDIEYYSNLWYNLEGESPIHTPEVWDRRAQKWIAELGEDALGKVSMNERVTAVVEYLVKRGIVTSETTMIDVGCGPGLFVVEFAKYAKKVVGLDYSPRFTEYGRNLAAQRGVTNVEFVTADFETLDLDEAKLAGAFDFAFASISPGVSSPEKIKKFQQLSRKWCNNISFARIIEDDPNVVKRTGHDGTGFYSLLNILWLSGYYPETYYFDEVRPGSVCRYGSLLWDTTKRDERTTNA